MFELALARLHEPEHVLELVQQALTASGDAGITEQDHERYLAMIDRAIKSGREKCLHAQGLLFELESTQRALQMMEDVPVLPPSPPTAYVESTKDEETDKYSEDDSSVSSYKPETPPPCMGMLDDDNSGESGASTDPMDYESTSDVSA